MKQASSSKKASRHPRASIELIDYDSDHVERRVVRDVEECLKYKLTPSVTWINIEGLRDTDVIKRVGERFDLHPVLLEDIADVKQRPKVEDYRNNIVILLKMFWYDTALHEVQAEHVSLILNPRFVITFQEGIKGDVFNPIRDHIIKGKGTVRERGTDYLVYLLLNIIVENYFTILERFGERLEHIENELTLRPTPKTLHAIQVMRRNMAMVRKSIWPLREVVSSLQKTNSEIIHDNTRIYFKDVYDHIIMAIDTMETYRDIVSGLTDVYLSSMSHRLNEVMKVLTVITTLFMPLTFITSLYGMNFEFMPGLHSRIGYPIAIIIMASIFIGMIIFFRKRRWI